jgi:CubicO group peptidase (beta-lactamase class C family)
MKKAYLLLWLLFVTISEQQVDSLEIDQNELDTSINEALEKWDVPGLAISIVKDGNVLFSKGYGVKNNTDKSPVDEKTLFAIGSTTKAFTAFALGQLVDEEKIDFDDPVTNYLPNFYLVNPYVTQEVTLRDFLCHRTGVKDHEGDLLWFRSPYDRQEIMSRLQYLTAETSFRAHFAYSNLLYLAAGEVIPQVTDQSYDEFIKKRIFEPLGMTSSSTTFAELKKSKNIASPHYLLDDKIVPGEWYSLDNIAPAASIVSNVVDMSKWLCLQINGGTFNETKLIKNETLEDILTPDIIFSSQAQYKKLFPNSKFLSYGLGWFINDIDGYKVVQHDGIINGMTAYIVFVPKQQFGLVILCNRDSTLLPQALAYDIMTKCLQLKPYDWKNYLFTLLQEVLVTHKQAAEKIEKDHILGTKPSLSLKDYVGNYDDNLYGKVSVTQNQDGLYLQLLGAKGKLEHWHYDTFRFYPDDALLLKPLITFYINCQGKVAALQAPTLMNNLFSKTTD